MKLHKILSLNFLMLHLSLYSMPQIASLQPSPMLTPKSLRYGKQQTANG